MIVVAFLGLKLSKSGDFQKSEPPPIVIAPKVIKAPTVELNVIFKEAEDLVSKNKLDEALKLYQSVLEQNSNNTRIHNDMGYIFLQKNLLSDAEKHLVLALEIDPMCSECSNNLGILRTRQGRAMEAEVNFNNAIVFNENFPEPYFNLGVLYEKNSDTGNAVVSYRDFLRRSSNKNSIIYVQVENRILTLTGK